MLTEAEIRAKYKKLHDELSDAYYAGTSELTKEEFDIQHGQIWADMEAELIAAGYRQPPPEPLAFTASPPGTAIGKRLNNMEDFLKRLHPGR